VVFKGFRDFIMRGNVVDLAVGVTIGVAFTGLVTQFTSDFINPLIKVVGGGKPLSGSIGIGHQHLLWADFVNAIINFLIIAAVLYFLVVLPLNKLAERRARNKPVAAPVVSDEVALLIEIRDALLSAQGSVAPSQRTGQHYAVDDATGSHGSQGAAF
jgi:large conductance mechanosensitive channel